MLDRYDYFFTWQLRRPDTSPRELAHVLALREAARQAEPSRSPLAWISEHLPSRSPAPAQTCTTSVCGAGA
jgi:hypothetical protein